MFKINGTSVLSNDTLGSNVVNTSITSTGALNSGSITSGFGNIDVGSSNIDGGTITADTGFTGNLSGTATNATHVTVTDNESTDEDNLITFVEDATSSTGNVGLEMDGNLTYNPSTGRLTATQLAGTLQTAAQTNITSVGTLSSLTVSGDATFDTSTLKVDSTNNRVGVGTSSPTYLLDVQQSGAPTTAASNTMARISGADSSANDLTLLGPNTSAVRINFGDEDDSNIGDIAYSHATNSMRFVTNGSERVRINSSGNVGIGTNSPDSLFHVYHATTNGIAHFESGDATCQISFSDNSTTAINYNAIGVAGHDMFFTTNAAERVRINSSGNFLIGTTSTTLYSATSGGGVQFLANGASAIARDGANSAIYINKTSSNSDAIQFRRAGSVVGEIYLGTSSTAYNTSSDYRLKENVIDLKDGLDRLVKLKPKRFNFIKDKDCTIDGFLAHEVQEVVHHAVTGEKDAVDEEGNDVYQSIDHSKMIPLLVAAIQELKSEIDTLKGGKS